MKDYPYLLMPCSFDSGDELTCECFAIFDYARWLQFKDDVDTNTLLYEQFDDFECPDGEELLIRFANWEDLVSELTLHATLITRDQACTLQLLQPYQRELQDDDLVVASWGTGSVVFDCMQQIWFTFNHQQT